MQLKISLPLILGSHSLGIKNPAIKDIVWLHVFTRGGSLESDTCCSCACMYMSCRWRNIHVYVYTSVQFSSVAQSCPTLWPHESQHARPPCPSPTPGVHSNSRPLSHWCHPAISSSVIPFFSCLQSFPASHLLAVQWTLKSLLQLHSSKASIVQRSAFFTVQPSHPYMTTGKIIALTRWIFVGKYCP